MKLVDHEVVDGTSVKIGRRVQIRTIKGKRVEEPSRTFTAVFREVNGRWREQGLGTTNLREARRKAIEIQQRLEAGRQAPVIQRPVLTELLKRYKGYYSSKGLAPNSVSKYNADLAKLTEFADGKGIRRAEEFDEDIFYQFRMWLETKKHKQGVTYSPKSVYVTLTLCKQVYKWAYLRKYLPENTLAAAELPEAKSKPQPCFTTRQVEKLLDTTTGQTRVAIAILAYAGLRVGELEQLRWTDVRLPKDRLGMIHVQRGGSAGVTKDKEARFVPVHPRIRPFLDQLRRTDELVLPGVRERQLLAAVKDACRACGWGDKYKLHSFRHHFASMCANHQVAFKKALSWLGHSSSDILDLYYHLTDDDSESAMQALASDQAHALRIDSAPRLVQSAVA